MDLDKLDARKLDMIARVVVGAICLGFAGFISLIATVALFGPHIAPLMNKLPW
jgi:UPF0716 family protein affecting phage T7 exclusion